MLAIWTLSLPLALAGEPFDHGYADLAAFLDGAVTEAGVRYDLLDTRRDRLEAHLASVAAAEVSSFTPQQQLAFYVNAYNGYTVQLVLEHRFASIRDLDGGKVWSTRKFPVAGESVTLDQMEHGHARKLTDGRVHAAVNCASRGCPPLPPAPLTAEGIESQLDAAARRWVATNAYGLKDGALGLSKIFDWYGSDFDKWRGGGGDGAHAAAIGFLRAYGLDDAATWQEIRYLPYDWSLNSVK